MEKKKIYIIFIYLSLFLGFIFSILIPLYQVPDEETHINNLYSYLGYNIEFNEENNEYGDTIRIIRNYDEKVDLENYVDLNKKLNIINNIKKIDIHIIRYLPQSIGIIISEIFNFPVIIAVTISEFLAVIFYTFICYLALKKIPIKKELMMFIMLLPICLQQMGSFSYDMMLNCFSFLFIAYIFYFKFEKKYITTKDLLILSIILIIIGLIKIPYILLGMLIFFIPKDKITLLKKINEKIKNKRLMNTFLIITILSIVTIVFFKLVINISYVKVLMAFFINPIDGLLLIIRTIFNYIDFYAISIVGYFGWHDTPVSILFGIFVIICMLIINLLSSHDNQKNKLKSKERILMFSFGIIFSIIIIISLFEWSIEYSGVNTLSFSIKDYSNYILLVDSIIGVQGRYFIPIIPLLIIPIDFNIKIKNKKVLLIIAQVIYYVIMFIYIFDIIIKRYWI